MAESLTAHLPQPGSYETQKTTIGPFPLENGTITGDQKQKVMMETWCTIVNRGKPGQPRVFQVVGHPQWVDQAYAMALAFIEENGKDGGRKSGEEQASLRAEQKEEATTSIYSPGLCSQGQLGGGPMLARPASIIDYPPPIPYYSIYVVPLCSSCCLSFVNSLSHFCCLLSVTS